MYPRIVLLSMLLAVVVGLDAQTVKVVDSQAMLPIKNVTVRSMDNERSDITNLKGEFDLSSFNSSDILIIQHATYAEQFLPYSEIKNLNYQIKLKLKSVILDEFVVSASKWEQNKNEIPNKIVAIDMEKIALSNPQTAADVLAASNEVFVQKSQLGGGSPMIRGFSANAVLLVIDGVRMNNAIYRSGNLQNVLAIDPNSLENVEVIFGPGSIIYGSDALGGVMDFHTQAVRLAPLNNQINTAKAFARFSTANMEQTVHADFMHSGGDWGSYTSLTLNRFGDLRMGSGGYDGFDRAHYVERINGQDVMLDNENVNIQKQSAYDQYNILQKFRYRPNEKIDINYAFHLTSSTDVPRYDRLNQYSSDLLKYSEWYYGPQFWHMQSLNIKVRDSVLLYDNFQFSAAYQKVKESRHNRKFGSDELKSREESVDVYSVNLDFDKSLDKKNNLFYGLEAIHNKVNSVAKTTNIHTDEIGDASTRYPDGGTNYYAYAAYVSLKSNLSEKFTFSSGIRLNAVGLKSTFIDKSFFDFPFDEIKVDNQSVNASLGLVFRPTKATQLNANISSGFRAPNLDDIAKIFDSTPGSVVMPNEDLKPEKAINIDLGMIHKVEDDFELNVSVFYTSLIDAMVRRAFTFNDQSTIMYDGELSQIEAIVNTGSANIYGASLGFDLKITDEIDLYTNHSFIKGKDNENESLRHVPPIYGVAGLSYQPEENLSFDFYINYNGTISYENLTPTEKEKEYLYASDENGNPYSPSWMTLNFKSSIDLSDDVVLNAGIENVMDVRYRPYSSGISAPGRNFIVSLNVEL